MFARCAALVILMISGVLGDDVALIRVGDVWRFLPGISEPEGPPWAWQRTGYDDTSWPAARSGFSGGYALEATTLPSGAVSYSAVYFRRTFTLTNPAVVKWLTLRIDYSDGFVACLNGREIARRNLDGFPGTPVPFNALATNFHARADPEELNVSAFRDVLVTGTNTLCVQVHSRSPSNYGLCLSAELMANFNRAPFLQNSSSNQVQIIWKTPVPASTGVELGLSSALFRVYLDTNLVTTHVASLTNLAPDTVYSYRVTSSADDDTISSPLESFRTFKTSGPVSFVVFGDGGWNSVAQYQLAEVMREAKPDLVFEAGDDVYPSFTSGLVDTRCFSVYQPQMRTTPFFFALGNHDLYSGVTNYLDAFYLPTNSVSWAEHAAAGTSPEHYYSFDAGDVHFTVLFLPFLNQYKLIEGDPQYRWLTNDLATSRQPWKIVIDHLPMNSSSAHRFDDTDFNGVYDRLDVRAVLLPVFSRYGVQLVLSGHEHGYERFNPTNGVHSITTAGGGVGLYGFSQLDFSSALYWARYNCVKVTVQGDTLEAQALGTDGEVFDAMSLQRALPPPQIYQAAWHSPALETTPANDNDGNIFGQHFDFAGEPIPTLAGRFSNLGRVYVNNDQTNLYVGLERVMIYGNNNIFLFLQSPRLDGVTHLLQAGNGLLDPHGQGADGLDFLANLSFTNFTPSVGCILGDEFADGQFRSFARTNLALNIGQGVFRLDAELSDVRGMGLQQFNLSPQIGGALGEENANFIELSIPLSELGGLQPGDSIRIGAVVGGAEFDVPEQSRFLDTGFLGIRLLGSGQAAVVLEGLEVQLASDPQADEDEDGLTQTQELALGTDPTRADSDGDGLPDGWEAVSGLDPLSANGQDGAGGDPDLDGFTNLQEDLAGTDPHNPDSSLRLTLEIPGSQTVRLLWRGVSGRVYQVQASDDSLSRFTDVAGASFPANGLTTNLSYDVDVSSPQAPWRFYRVRLAPQPTH